MSKIRLRCCNLNCNNIVERWPSRLEHSRIVYCSTKCQGRAKQRRVTVICAYCGNEFERRPFRVNGSDNYCCRKHWQKMLHEQAEKPLGPKPLCACGCGQVIESTRNGKWCQYIKGHNWRGKTHSAATRAKMHAAAFARRKTQARRIRGANNPMWRGGRTSAYQNERKEAGWNWWHADKMREKLLTERGNRCERCGKGSIKLELHHIDHNLFHNVPDNFQLLCRDCHAKVTYEFIQCERAQIS